MVTYCLSEIIKGKNIGFLSWTPQLRDQNLQLIPLSDETSIPKSRHLFYMGTFLCYELEKSQQPRSQALRSG